VLGPEPKRRGLFLFVAALTAASLLPFVGKAFHMDDPLFIWSARQIQAHPLDFYGFQLNWDGWYRPMPEVTQNPPLASYYAALIGSILGWSEIALHLGFILPALAVILGTYALARILGSHPLAAALITGTAPVFVMSASSVMCDTMMLALWVWAAVFWIEGLRSGNAARLGLAALLIAACGLTKYFGISLVPLLGVYSWMELRRVGPWLAYLLFPMIVLGGYQWMTHGLYGHGLLSSAASYATQFRVPGEAPEKILTALAFSGGCIVILSFAAPVVWGKKGLAVGALATAAIALLVVSMKKVGTFHVVDDTGVKWGFVAQFAVFVVSGLSLALLAFADWRGRKDAGSTLLALWVAWTLTFAVAVNWTTNGRTILPILPAGSILLVRRVERRGGLVDPGRARRLEAPLAASLLVALLVASADFKLADSARTAAASLARLSGDVRFQGHWGFQYYMERLGAKALQREALDFKPNDLIVVPMSNSYLFLLPEDRVSLLEVRRFETTPWLATMDNRTGAGYYSDGWGPLPFVFGPTPAEVYLVFRAK
jgi:hypothetical protein